MLPNHGVQTGQSVTHEPVVLSWSGGKDSALALAALRENERYDVVGLMTSITREYDRISIHGVRRTLLDAQVAALGLPVFELTIDPDATNDAYEAAFRDTVERLRAVHPQLGRIAFGDLFLEDVRAYRERLMDDVGLSPLFPLWGLNTTVLADAFVAHGYRAHVVCVDTTQLSATFAGAEYDAAFLKSLPGTVDPCGERGEFHTFVSDGPIFARPVRVVRGDVVIRESRFAYCDLTLAA